LLEILKVAVEEDMEVEADTEEEEKVVYQAAGRVVMATDRQGRALILPLMRRCSLFLWLYLRRLSYFQEPEQPRFRTGRVRDWGPSLQECCLTVENPRELDAAVVVEVGPLLQLLSSAPQNPLRKWPFSSAC
jgi:hypothetical protein